MISGRSAPSFRPSTPLACAQRTHSCAFSGVLGVPLPQPDARALVVEDARRDDLVARAALLLLHRERVVGERHAAHRRHAVGEPQLVRVLRVGVLGRAAGVHVQVDEAGHARTCRSRRSRSRPSGSRFGRSGSPGVPALRIAVMRLPSTTMSTGPRGGPPVPSISIAPRITIVAYGTEALALSAVGRRRQRLAAHRRVGQRLNRVLRPKRDARGADGGEDDERTNLANSGPRDAFSGAACPDGT